MLIYISSVNNSELGIMTNFRVSASTQYLYSTAVPPEEGEMGRQYSGSICSDPFSVGAEILKHAIAQHCL